MEASAVDDADVGSNDAIFAALALPGKEVFTDEPILLLKLLIGWLRLFGRLRVTPSGVVTCNSRCK